MKNFDYRKAFTELALQGQKFLAYEAVPREEFQAFFEKLDAVQTQVMEENPTLTLNDYLAKRQKDKHLKGSMLPPSVYACLINNGFFTVGEMATLTNTTSANISNKVRRGDRDMGSVEIGSDIGNSLDELNPTETYVEALKSIQLYINSKTVKDDQKVRAIEVLLRNVEPQVISELKAKFQTLSNLMTFFLNYLIPEANKRVRAILRDLKERRDNGEAIDNVIIDLRLIFKELLPQSQELYKAIQEIDYEAAYTEPKMRKANASKGV